MSDENLVRDAGASTDQHVSWGGETGEFTTDQAPTADTEASGSNAGVNAEHGNRADDDPAGDEDVTG